MRAWALANPERAAAIKERWAELNPAKVKASHQAYALANPEKIKARSALDYAVRSGRVVRPDRCEACGGVGPVEGHHPDYALPLDVVWLCRRCHVDLHST